MTEALGPLRKSTGLSIYYLGGTLFFWGLDALVHVPVRVALATPLQRGAYYAGLLALGLVCRARPRWAPVVGIVESTVNLTLLFVGLWLPILALSDQVLAGGEGQAPFSVWRVLNAALALGVMMISLRRSEAALGRMAGRRP